MRFYYLPNINEKVKQLENMIRVTDYLGHPNETLKLRLRNLRSQMNRSEGVSDVILSNEKIIRPVYVNRKGQP